VSVWKKIKIVEERERAPFYEFTPGKHRLKFVEVVDLDKPFEQEFRGRTRYIMRTVVQDLDTEEYYRWWLDVTQFWNPEEDTFFVPRKSKAYSAALLRHAAEVGGLEGRSFEVEVTGTGREKRYVVKPIEPEKQLKLEVPPVEKPPAKLEEVVVKPEVRPPTVDEEALREDYRRLLEALPEELAIKTLSVKYSIPEEDVSRIISPPAAKAAKRVEVASAAHAALKVLRDYGTMDEISFKKFVEEAYGVDPNLVVKTLVEEGSVVVEKGEIRARKGEG